MMPLKTDMCLGRLTHHAWRLRSIGVERVGRDDLHTGVPPAVGRRVAKLMVVVVVAVIMRVVVGV